MAQQIVRHPAHPIDFEICWNNVRLAGECRKASQFASGNLVLAQPGQGYVLVPTVLGGAHEWMAHVTQLLLAWVAILTFTSLVFRFGWGRGHAIAGALLLVAIPPFLPMAGTAMPDILATAITLVAMERLAAWKEQRKVLQGIEAAIALGLAGFARPHLVLFLPLAAFFLLDSIHPREILAGMRRNFWLWTPVLAGCVLLAGLILSAREHNQSPNTPAVPMVWAHVPHNLFSYLMYLVFPMPVGACWLANRMKSGRRRAVIYLLATAVLLSVLPIQPHLVTFLEVTGFGVLTGVCVDAWKKQDLTHLFLVLWILIPLPIVLYIHLPIKFLLPCVPAVILLCFRLMEVFSARVAGMAAIAMVIAGIGYSLLIVRSDAEFAEFGRDSMARLITPHVAAGERVWYVGQYWSNWYAPLDGATLTYLGGPQPKRGDLVVVDLLAESYFAGGYQPPTQFPHRTLVAATTHKYRFGRTMGAGLGLYSNSSRYWMWGFGESPYDRYELWRID